jgi:hypothetical protein
MIEQASTWPLPHYGQTPGLVGPGLPTVFGQPTGLPTAATGVAKMNFHTQPDRTSVTATTSDLYRFPQHIDGLLLEVSLWNVGRIGGEFIRPNQRQRGRATLFTAATDGTNSQQGRQQ